MLVSSRIIFQSLGRAVARQHRPLPTATISSVRFYYGSPLHLVKRPDTSDKGVDSEGEQNTSVSSASQDYSIFPKFLQPYLPLHSKGWVMLGSGVVALGVSRVFYSVMYSFLELTPAASLYYGFMGGIITAASSAMVIWWGDQTFRVAPERAVQYSLELLNKSKAVTDVLGSGAQLNSVVRSYSIVHSQIGFKGVAPKWISPFVEVAYTVKAKNSDKEAIVTCVYGKKGIDEVVDYLAIEPISAQDSNKKVVIMGKEALFTIQSQLKKHGEDLTRSKTL